MYPFSLHILVHHYSSRSQVYHGVDFRKWSHETGAPQTISVQHANLPHPQQISHWYIELSGRHWFNDGTDIHMRQEMLIHPLIHNSWFTKENLQDWTFQTPSICFLEWRHFHILSSLVAQLFIPRQICPTYVIFLWDDIYFFPTTFSSIINKHFTRQGEQENQIILQNFINRNFLWTTKSSDQANWTKIRLAKRRSTNVAGHMCTIAF